MSSFSICKSQNFTFSNMGKVIRAYGISVTGELQERETKQFHGHSIPFMWLWLWIDKTYDLSCFIHYIFYVTISKFKGNKNFELCCKWNFGGLVTLYKVYTFFSQQLVVNYFPVTACCVVFNSLLTIFINIMTRRLPSMCFKVYL